MKMHHFSPPSELFVAEMIQTNLAADKPSLDLSKVPHSVLAKVVHCVIQRNLVDDSAPKVEISVGPDQFYHHEIKGISIVTPSQAQVFYEHDGDWFSVMLLLTGADHEIFVVKLVDDAEDEWDMLDPNEAPDFVLHHRMCADALAYLGVLETVAS